jgi:hypothetical protein
VGSVVGGERETSVDVLFQISFLRVLDVLYQSGIDGLLSGGSLGGEFVLL